MTGVVEPRAIVTIEGRTKKTTLYLQPKNERREQRMLGPGLSPGEAIETLMKEPGLTDVMLKR